MSRPKLNEQLRQWRRSAGLSQIQVAKKIGLSSPQYISNIERGVSTASVDVLVKLCKVYGADPRGVVDLMVDEYRQSLNRRFMRIKTAV